MTRLFTGILALCVATFANTVWAAQGEWEVLIEGERGLDNWNRIGDANWHAHEGAIVADQGKGGFLVTRKAYRDFEIRAEFWAESNTNSGVFIRAADPANVSPQTSYEVNIYDRRPDPTYATGGIVNVAKVITPQTSAGKWNTIEITARGSQFIVKVNGVETAKGEDSKYAAGPFALQFGVGPEGATGAIKWRKVEVRARD